MRLDLLQNGNESRVNHGGRESPVYIGIGTAILILILLIIFVF
jgi:hypothetical protein